MACRAVALAVFPLIIPAAVNHLAAHGNRRTVDSVGTALAALKAAAATTAVLRTARTIGRGARNNALSATGGALEDD